jgi:hypothetical protein
MLLCGVVFAEAYRWVDENGVVHYSDRPHPGAEQVQLPESEPRRRPTPRAAPAARSAAVSNTKESAAQPNTPVSYESLEVASPAAEETLWNIEGVLNVTLDLQPALQQGHQVRVYFDGRPQMVEGTSFQLNEVFRGAHNIQAEVLDQSGKLMIRSLPNRFYVQQNSIAGR